MSELGPGFPIRQLLTTQPHMLALPKETAPAISYNSLPDSTLYLSHAFWIVRKARPKQCSESIVSIFFLDTHIRRFQRVQYIQLQLVPIFLELHTSKQDPRNITPLVSYLK